MNITNYILPTYFFASLCIGFLLTYIFTPAPEIIIQYPTPDNVGKITYTDKAGTCYKYNAIKVKCPANNKISKIPIQENLII